MLIVAPAVVICG
jgi:hypothetical protein